MTESTKTLIARLDALLGEGFAVEGDNLESKVRKLGKELPEELRDLLLELATENSASLDGEAAIQFAFRCGLAYERLENQIQSRLAAQFAFLETDGSQPVELEEKDLDAIARFIRLRDHVLKTVADYTLKFLLVSAVLLVLGLSLGLI